LLGDGPFDLIVIGAGINGTGIARDAALRGLRVLLLDKGDIASGTTSWSSRLIHGGLRYLEYGEIALVRESLAEREHLLRHAPHLVHPLPLMIPIYEDDRRGKNLIRLGLTLYDLLSLDKSLDNHRMLSPQQALQRAPGLAQENLEGAGLYSDAQAPYAERLAVENALDAAAHGATVLTFCRVDHLLMEPDGRTIRGVAFTDVLCGTTHEASAPIVVNVAGPWVDAVLRGETASDTSSTAPAIPDPEDQTEASATSAPTEQAPPSGAAPESASLRNAMSQFLRGFINQFRPKGPDARRLVGGTKGTHIIVEPFPGAPQDALYVEARSDGRPFFIIPWNGLFLIGTTDERYDGDLDHVEATPDEISYLITETNRVLPTANLSPEKVLYTYSGVRPLPYQDDGPAGSITRRHIIFDHEPDVPGLISIVGGKLTTFRALAEQTVDVVFAKRDETNPPCRTDIEPFPGARLPQGRLQRRHLREYRQVLAHEFDDLNFTDQTIEHLFAVYGTRAEQVAQLARADQRLRDVIDPESGAIAAEVVFAIKQEFAQTLSDILLRRAMIGYGPHSGLDADEAAAHVAGEHLGWSSERQQDEVTAYRNYLRRYHPHRLRADHTEFASIS
jgi:glycerol-3-phosphate dehydrogenase